MTKKISKTLRKNLLNKMMPLSQKILDDLKIAMKSGDIVKRDTLRMLDSMIRNVEIEKKKREAGLSDKEIQELIRRAIKQRKEASSQYKIGGRDDLAQKEEKEVAILSIYVPQQMSENEIRKQVQKIITEVGATKIADLGRVMGAIMKRLENQADGQTVKKIVQEELK